MASDLHKTVKAFLEDVEFQFPEEHRALIEALEAFMDLYKDRLISQRTAARTLRQLSRYLARKGADLHPDAVAKRAETLRGLRNRLTHGKRPSREELKLGYDTLWRALLKGARKLDPRNLLNLLAYSLRTPPNAVSKTDDQVRIISAFRAIFKTMPPDQQERAFTELLVRLFSEPEFVQVLDPGKSGRR